MASVARDDTVSETRLLLLQEFKKLESITKQLANFLSTKLERLKYVSLETRKERESQEDAEKVPTSWMDASRLQPAQPAQPAKKTFLGKAYEMVKPLVPAATVGAAVAFGPDIAKFAGAAVNLFGGPTPPESPTPTTTPSKPTTFFEKISQPIKNLFQSTGDIKPVGMTGSAKEALDFFIAKGWTPEQAAGIVGNLQTESNLKTDALGDSGQAYGIAQWHPDRQQNFKQWSRGKDIRQSNFREQLEFVHHELTEGQERKAGNLLRRATTPEEAASIVDKFYERSSGQARQQRIANAIALYNTPENVSAPNDVGRQIAQSTPPTEQGTITNNIYTQQVISTDSGDRAGGTITTPMPSPESVRYEYLRI